LDGDQIPRPCRGQSWSAKIGARQFRGSHEELDAWSASLREARNFGPVFSDVPSVKSDGTIVQRYSPEIKIEARKRFVAQRALNLIRACSSVLNGDVFLDFEGWIAVPVDDADPEDLDEREVRTALRRQHLAAPGLARACAMAAKVSRSRALQYATYKLFLSLRAVSAPNVELDPRQSPHKFGVESDPINHVILANAVTLAYSSIEELQLEPRGSKEEPSTMPDGTWNPKRLANLEGRLKKARIDITRELVWTTRGTPTRVERTRHPRGKKASWAKGPVRDQEIAITDALRNASGLRNKITTHKFNKTTASLTFYDAHNVQFLARRLIMEHLGLWLSFKSSKRSRMERSVFRDSAIQPRRPPRISLRSIRATSLPHHHRHLALRLTRRLHCDLDVLAKRGQKLD
jgi:hypothetical protein